MEKKKQVKAGAVKTAVKETVAETKEAGAAVVKAAAEEAKEATAAVKAAAAETKENAAAAVKEAVAEKKEQAEKAKEEVVKMKKTTRTAKKAKTVQEELKPEIVLQFQGKEALITEAIDKAKAEFVAAGHRMSSIKSLQIYLKPEEYAAYYVINQKFAGKVDLF